ncbi:cupin domain-containing protein [Actinopolymorpha alba]|uniref:cupin domain-containing protein n=1 Tax=Actinopolymorpha alba TaxID=533267 RepID=UPI00036EEFC8|nr:cupin domain-containing protein [Actinopolymorpha alba]
MTAEAESQESPVGHVTGHFPGGTAVSRVRIYDWPTADGLHGGSPHAHFVCTEGYAVLGGVGRLQTLGPEGYVECPLRPGDVVWFTPGVIHRAVNDGGLDILVVMQNAGLPEAGDAVLTMPPGVLANPERYAAEVSLASGDTAPASARRRRDLAIEGFRALRRRVLAEGAAGLADFYFAALALIGPRLSDWEKHWRDGPLAAVEETGRQLAALRDGDLSHLGAGGVFASPPPAERWGMCGRLSAYDPAPNAADRP